MDWSPLMVALVSLVTAISGLVVAITPVLVARLSGQVARNTRDINALHQKVREGSTGALTAPTELGGHGSGSPLVR